MCKLKPILERWLDDAERYLNPSSTSMTEQQLESARRRKKRTSIDSTIKGGMLGTLSLSIYQSRQNMIINGHRVKGRHMQGHN